MKVRELVIPDLHNFKTKLLSETTKSFVRPAGDVVWRHIQDVISFRPEKSIFAGNRLDEFSPSFQTSQRRLDKALWFCDVLKNLKGANDIIRIAVIPGVLLDAVLVYVQSV